MLVYVFVFQGKMSICSVIGCSTPSFNLSDWSGDLEQIYHIYSGR